MQEITTLTWGDIYQRKMEEMTWERAYEQAVLQEEAEQRRKRRGWRKLLRPDDVVIGSVYGSADGMVKVQDKTTRGQFYGKVLQPIHTEVGKGDVFIYDYDDLYSGDGRDLEGLRDYILDGVKHKNVDDVNIHPRMNEEEILLYEKSLSGAEIEDLISSARKAAQKIKNDRKRPEAERNDAEDVLDFIKDIKDVWDRKNNLHPNQVNALMRIVAGVSSANPKGWGFRTKGWKSSPDGKVPSNYRNEEELNEGTNKRGLSDAVIKAGALQAKRWIIQQGREVDVSGQLNGIASLLLFNMALTDRGASFMSKALATSAFFKERGK
jgi:hypothetical protein